MKSDLEKELPKILDDTRRIAYNQAIDDALKDVRSISRHYPSGKTKDRQFFSNPTREALQSVINELESLKKKQP